MAIVERNILVDCSAAVQNSFWAYPNFESTCACQMIGEVAVNFDRKSIGLWLDYYACFV